MASQVDCRRTIGSHVINPLAISVVIGGNHPLFLEALGTILDMADGIDILAVADRYDDVIPVMRQTRPAVLLLGESSTDVKALGTARAVHVQLPKCRVALMAVAPTSTTVDRALAAGVLGIVPTDTRLRLLITVVRGVAAGCLTVDPNLMRAAEMSTSSLNNREEDVLRLTATGATVKEIAGELYLASGTVRNLTSVAMRKLGGRNRFDAARIAEKKGWL